MPSLLRRLKPFFVLFLALETALRLSLLARAVGEVGVSFADILQLLLRGLWFDCATAGYVLGPLVLYHLLLPARLQGGKVDRRIDAGWRFIYAFALLFDIVAEHLFWTEFSTRFNFIAVDYLIYTQEVVGNIRESYPLPVLFTAMGLVAGLLAWLSMRRWELAVYPVRIAKRAGAALVLGAACGILYLAASQEQSAFSENTQANELASSGIYSLFYAFWHNEIDYRRFYTTLPDDQVRAREETLLASPEASSKDDNGLRLIRPAAPEKRKNVIIVVMESLSADYIGLFGNAQGLTPNLDRLAREGLSFNDTYATGTRTVRGLEAVTLSIPPTPGQSILRRPGNEGLFSLGYVFTDRGYDAKFLYGGYGYFDNMNAFFSGNGFGIVDRASLAPEEIHFANAWGVCDEDMAVRLIAEGDKSYAQGRPFVSVWMTTSNHRPFTYPAGRIDLPGGRDGGVKYADYSVGQLVEGARGKPWFKDTVFIFVADHTAGAAGKAELDPHKYHIPMIFYGSGLVPARQVDKLASQIDLAPTLLGLLDFHYPSKFYGRDLLLDEQAPHAFISNYQKVALAQGGTLTVLAPRRRSEQYSWPQMEKTAPDAALREDAITYYQSASQWKERYRRVPTVLP